MTHITPSPGLGGQHPLVLEAKAAAAGGLTAQAAIAEREALAARVLLRDKVLALFADRASWGWRCDHRLRPCSSREEAQKLARDMFGDASWIPSPIAVLAIGTASIVISEDDIAELGPCPNL